MRAQWTVAALLLAAGCGESFKPESVVTDLRVLGIRAEPAELRPGEATALSALVVDPTRPASARTLVWLSCDPDPFGHGRSACSDIAQLQDLSQLLSAGGAVNFPPGMRFAGFGEVGAYSVAADVFAPLPADDRRRLTGTVAQILLLSVAEAVSPFATQEELDALLDRIARKEVPFIATLFRVRVSEETQRNTNPVLDQVVFNGLPVPADGSLLRIPATEALELETLPTAASYEAFTLLTPEGSEPREEALVAAYYTTAGRFSVERVSLKPGTSTRFEPPGLDNDDEIPPGREGRIWTVVRDTRGGQVWRELPFYLCDASLPVPSLSSVSPPNPPAGTRITLQGENLGSVLEVVADGWVLGDLRFSSATGALEVTVPTLLPPGTYPLLLRSRMCTDVQTSLTVTVP